MERNATRLISRVIIVVMISGIAAIIIGTGINFWNYFNMSSVDVNLRIAFIGLIIVMITVLANIVVSRWW